MLVMVGTTLENKQRDEYFMIYARKESEHTRPSADGSGLCFWYSVRREGGGTQNIVGRIVVVDLFSILSHHCGRIGTIVFVDWRPATRGERTFRTYYDTIPY